MTGTSSRHVTFNGQPVRVTYGKGYSSISPGTHRNSRHMYQAKAVIYWILINIVFHITTVVNIIRMGDYIQVNYRNYRFKFGNDQWALSVDEADLPEDRSQVSGLCGNYDNDYLSKCLIQSNIRQPSKE